LYPVLPVTLAPRATVLIPNQGVLPGQSGSVTIAHDGPYGALAGKAVAVDQLEPAEPPHDAGRFAPRPRPQPILQD
jgi:hypothetical protein